MTDRKLRAFLWVVLAFTVGMLTSPILLVLPEEGLTLDFLVGFGLSVVILILAGWLTLKVPHNRVTWVLLLGVSSALVAQAARDYVDAAMESSLPFPRLLFALHIGGFWVGVGLLVVMFTLLFPTGKPPTVRWWWVAWLGMTGVLIQLAKATYLAVTLPSDALVDETTGVGWIDTVVFIGQGMVAVAGVAALVSLVVRFVRSTGIERQQLKWMLFPFTFLVMFWAIESVSMDASLGMVFLIAFAVTFPVAIGMAILKHRLYEIDRILSRTVSYTLVVGLLAAVFVGLVAVVTSILPAQGSLAVAGSTLAVAALFNPVRIRVQGWVDRRFNRSRYDAERVIDVFSDSLRAGVDQLGLVDGWVGVVEETMQPTGVGVWVRD